MIRGKNKGYIALLLKSLYKLKQAPRIWVETLGRELEVLRLSRLEIKHSIYIFINRKNKELKGIYIRSDLVIRVYVDDILIIRRNKTVIQDFKDSFRKKFNIKDIEEIQNYLKIKIIRNRAAGILRISQNKYIKDILKRYNIENCNPQPILIPDGIRIDTTNKDYLNKAGYLLYQQIINSLTYAMQGTRSDIVYLVSFCSRFLTKPTRKYMELLKKVLRYLKGVSDFGIIYVRYGDNFFLIYINSNYNKKILFNSKDLQVSKEKGKVILGWGIFLTEGLIS